MEGWVPVSSLLFRDSRPVAVAAVDPGDARVRSVSFCT